VCVALKFHSLVILGIASAAAAAEIGIETSVRTCIENRVSSKRAPPFVWQQQAWKRICFPTKAATSLQLGCEHGINSFLSSTSSTLKYLQKYSLFFSFLSV
jgi:hypothetical protein